jgi:hypothetical protein
MRSSRSIALISHHHGVSRRWCCQASKVTIVHSGSANAEAHLDGAHDGGGERRLGPLAGLAFEQQDPMALIVREVLDVMGDRLADSEPVGGQQLDQGR